MADQCPYIGAGGNRALAVQDHAKTIGLLALLVALHYGYHLAAPGDRAISVRTSVPVVIVP